MDGRLTWTDCDEAGDYVVPNVISPRDLVFRPDNMDETVPHTFKMTGTSCTDDARVKVRSFQKVTLFNNITYSTDTLSIYIFVCLKMLLTAVI